MFTEHWPSSAEVYLPGGRAPVGDALYALPAQAATYERIVREAEAAGADRLAQIEAARRAWYEGFVAEAIDAFFRDARDGHHRRAARRAPHRRTTSRRGPPPSRSRSRSTTATTPSASRGRGRRARSSCSNWRCCAGFDVAAMDPDGPEFVHVVQECAKLAFADREAFYGDPAFAEVPLGVLLSEAYNADRRRLVRTRRRSTSCPVRFPATAGG